MGSFYFFQKINKIIFISKTNQVHATPAAVPGLLQDDRGPFAGRPQPRQPGPQRSQLDQDDTARQVEQRCDVTVAVELRERGQLVGGVVVARQGTDLVELDGNVLEQVGSDTDFITFLLILYNNNKHYTDLKYVLYARVF